MIIIRMTGGMGNQMFQYALYLKLKALHKDVKLDDTTEYRYENARPLMLWAFGLSYEKASQEEINCLTDGSMKTIARLRRRIFGRKSQEYREKPFQFDPGILQLDTAYLTGYFQSEKYFSDIRRAVRSSFQFTEAIWNNLEPDLQSKLKGYTEVIAQHTAVAVHVRRGDYLENQEQYGHICTEAYYRKGVNLILERYPEAIFVVFSNETEWVRERIKEMYGDDSRCLIIEGTTEETGYLSMMLMSRCRHHIIANSSFSWWGAWLPDTEDKLVIAPAKWNNRAEFEDIYTENMVRITKEGELLRMKEERS